MKKYFILLSAAVLLLCSCSCAKKEAEITIITQNVRQSGDSSDPDVLYRSEGLIALIEKYQPDVMGVQEYTPGWHLMMEPFYEESSYEIAMQYRSSASQEATGIIYNADRLELLYEEYFWLSDTPHEESKSWDDEFARIVTRCDFKDKKTGVNFTHLNTHYGLTFKSQENAGAQIYRYIKENLMGKAVFLTGDINCDVGSGGYINTTAEDLLVDSFLLADSFGETTGTFNGFTGEAGSAVIDYVFLTPEKILPSYYSVLTDQPDGVIISDHFAVMAKCTVKK
ncbi:MAG: endonuclease/exonuclease/phosphatase family protein [Clostridia bacterium]|nr:endonuclease/exonuclease/phosphatase family protein [Clostridia bacterium]